MYKRKANDDIKKWLQKFEQLHKELSVNFLDYGKTFDL